MRQIPGIGLLLAPGEPPGSSPSSGRCPSDGRSPPVAPAAIRHREARREDIHLEVRWTRCDQADWVPTRWLSRDGTYAAPVRDIERRGRTRLFGWLCLTIGPVVGLAGVYMAWDARLHNAIVSHQVENPWPGYIVAAVGIGLIVIGVASVSKARQSPSTITPDR